MVGDRTAVPILKTLKQLSQQHASYFQRISSQIGLYGNETADPLAKEGASEITTSSIL